jgi:hypothetical protein
MDFHLFNFLVICSNVLKVTSEENQTENNLKLESEKEQFDVIQFDENMADMNLENFNLHGSREPEDSSISDSSMIIFDEDILEAGAGAGT